MCYKVEENSPSGTVIGVFQAVDPDDVNYVVAQHFRYTMLDSAMGRFRCLLLYVLQYMI